MGGAVAARPVHPECPDASSGCIEGPAQPSVWGRADPRIGDRVARALRYASVKAPALLRVSGLGRSPIVFATGRACDLWTITVHACYSIRVITTPDAPTIHYGTPLSHFVPPCSTSDTKRGTPPVPFFGKVSHRPDRDGTLWDGMGHLTQKSTAQRPNYPLSTTPIDHSTQPQGRSRTSRLSDATAGRRRCRPSRTAKYPPSRRPGRRTSTRRSGREARSVHRGP